MVKKLFLSAGALFLIVASACARVSVTVSDTTMTLSAAVAAVSDTAKATPAAAPSTAHGHDPSVNTLTGGFAIDYLTDGDFNGVGLNWAGRYFVVDGGYSSYSEGGVSTSSWNVGIGGHYRYWFNKWLYCEGNLGVFYGNTSFEYEVEEVRTMHYDTPALGEGDRTYTATRTEEDSDGGFGLFLTPRLGVKIFTLKNGNALSLVAGYRWNFGDFKFDKEHTSDYFSIGIAGVF